MRVTRHIPNALLCDSIECIWCVDEMTAIHAWERVLPSGSMQLLVDLGGEPLRLRKSPGGGEEHFLNAVWAGAYADSFIIPASRRQPLLGVAFKPGGAAAFLDMPADELHGQHVALENVWKRETAELLGRLHDTPGTAAQFQCVEAMLLRRLRRARPPHTAVTFALAEFQRHTPPPGVGTLVKRAGWSHRRFVEVFRETVGLTPKQYSRVRRLQAVLERMADSPQWPWVDIALDYGFADQAHLIHEFHEMTGMTPTAYAAQRGPYANHAAVPGGR